MKRSLNALIPMAGRGTRFQKAGYSAYKPFVPVLGKPMIQWVLDAFPPHVTCRILADRTLLTDDQLDYLQAQDNVVVHFVESHSLGPAYTVYLARDELPLDESFFISYCDIFWTWDFDEVEALVDHDGVVFTRRSFHPHLVGNSYSAFCRPADDEPYVLREIREKEAFTDDWMTEPLSVGCFFVRDGRAMMRAIERMIEENQRVSNEFFPSLLFNDLVENGRSVRLHDVDFFVHWGVPEQLEDLVAWVSACSALREAPTITTSTNVCCMGGVGARMAEYGTEPKQLLPVADESPMFQFVAQRFGCSDNVFVVNESLTPSLSGRMRDGERIIDIGPATSSQLATLQKVEQFLSQQSRFYLTSCDAFGFWDCTRFERYLDRVRPEAVIFTFEPTLLQSVLDGSHTYVTADADLVSDVHIKHRPKGGQPQGLAGFFWFDNGSVFRELAQVPDDPGRELCADHVLKYMVDAGRRVGAFPLDRYLHLGSPFELEEFAFWWRFHRVLRTAAEPDS